MAIWRFVWLVLCIVSIGTAVPVLFSGSLRSDYAFVINRKIASIWPPKYAFVGNSLTAGCNWRWELGSLSVVNLATGGAVIREVTHQLTQVLPLKPRLSRNLLLLNGSHTISITYFDSYPPTRRPS